MVRPFYPLVEVTWNTLIHADNVLVGYYMREQPKSKAPKGYHRFRLHQLLGQVAPMRAFIAAFDHGNDESFMTVRSISSRRTPLFDNTTAAIVRTTWCAELSDILVYGPLDLIIPEGAVIPIAAAEDRGDR